MKRKIVKIFAIALAAVTVCLFVSSCGGVSSVLKKYDSSQERYDYDLSEYITIPNYKGIEIPDLEYTPSEEKIANTRYRKLAYFSEEYKVPDGTVEKYDIVDCDFTCTANGVQYADLSSASNSALRSFVVGIGEYDIPEIDEGIIGMAPGETKTIEFIFPEPYYRDPLVSGMSGEFTVTIDCIRRQEYEEYNDDFVSQYYGSGSAEAYDMEIATQLKSDYSNYLENYEITLAWDYIHSNSEMIKLPGKEYAEISDETVKNYRALADESEVDFEEYVKTKLGYDSLDSFYSDVDTYVRETLKEEMILYVIARCENITLDDSEYEEALLAFAKDYETTDIDFCERLAVEEYGSIAKFKEVARLQKVYSFIGQSALKIDAAEYYAKKAAGNYVFDADAARGMSVVEILIIVFSCVGAVIIIVILVLAVKAAKLIKKKKITSALEAEREEIRRRRREEKQAKKKHHKNEDYKNED